MKSCFFHLVGSPANIGQALSVLLSSLGISYFVYRTIELVILSYFTRQGAPWILRGVYKQKVFASLLQKVPQSLAVFFACVLIITLPYDFHNYSPYDFNYYLPYDFSQFLPSIIISIITLSTIGIQKGLLRGVVVICYWTQIQIQ